MNVKGEVTRVSGYNEQYKSVGIQVNTKWYNIKGTLDECNKKTEAFSLNDTVSFEADEKNTVTSGIEVITNTVGEITNLKKISRDMSDCITEAMEICKPMSSDGFVSPDVVGGIAIEIFQELKR